MASASAAPGTAPAGVPSPSPPAYLLQSYSDIQNRFVDLEWGQRNRLAQGLTSPAPSTFSRLSGDEITRRNRYLNIDPFNSNRVKLRVAGEGESDYINASPIALRCRRSGMQKRYIATQGPKELSTAHFWLMVWHEAADPAVIVMLTQTHEAGKEKCFRYFPAGEPSSPALQQQQRNGAGVSREKLALEAGAFKGTVELLETRFDEKLRSTVRRLKLTVGGKSKTVFHYLFEGWPDFGIPEGDDKLALIELVKDTADKAAGKGRANNVVDGSGIGNEAHNPRIVHCSAGVGRSGTFIALDYLMTELAEGSLDDHHREAEAGEKKQGKEEEDEEEEDRIAETVDDLRKQRMMMVQGESQFHFLYETLRQMWIERNGSSRR